MSVRARAVDVFTLPIQTQPPATGRHALGQATQFSAPRPSLAREAPCSPPGPQHYDGPMSSYPPYPYAAESEPESPIIDRSDKHRVWQLVCGVIAVIVAEFAAGTVSVLMFAVEHRATPASYSDLSGVELLTGMCVGAAVAIVSYVLIMRFVAQAPGLGLRGRFIGFETLIGLGVGTVLIAVSVGIIAVLGGYRITGIHASAGMLAPLAAGIGAGFMEEIFFRGFLLRLLDAWLGSWWALLISSLVFGAVHVTNPGATTLGTIGIMISAGALLGGAYLLTRKLWLPIAIHVSWNFVQGGIFSSSISGTGQSDGLLSSVWAGPDWLTGGPMGIEGSIVTVAVALLAAGGILHLAVRQNMIVGRDARKLRAT